jgi:hypothetical protein
MKRMGSGGKKSRSSGSSTRREPRSRPPRGARYVLCVKNDGYPASLEVRKVYCALGDRDGAKHGQRRVIDESGEDYLFPRRYFIDLPVPPATRRALSSTFK